MKRYLLVVVLGLQYLSCQAAPATVLALEGQYPDMDAALKLVKNNERDLAAYLNDTKTVCTFFIPTSEALLNSIKWLGKFAGKAAQNVSLGRSTLSYHVVPGQALTAEQLGARGGVSRALTRANETMYFWQKGGQSYVYARPDLPAALNRTDIKAGRCIVHTIDRAQVPPTANSLVQGWLEETGNMPKVPQSQWAPKQQPLPDSIEAGGQGTPAAAAAPAAAAKSSSFVPHMRSSNLPWQLVMAVCAAWLLVRCDWH